jgi:hypothetical protein
MPLAGLALTLLGSALVGLSTQVFPGPQAVAVEGATYNVDASMGDNLKAFTGKKVNVTLDSGVIIVGLVKGVGDHLVHLEKLAGKEYFDALIRIDRIDAIDARFRQIQR